MKQSQIISAALLAALAAGPCRLALAGDILTVSRGEAVIRQTQIAADLPDSERQKLRGGVWAANAAGLTAILEDYT